MLSFQNEWEEHQEVKGVVQYGTMAKKLEVRQLNKLKFVKSVKGDIVYWSRKISTGDNFNIIMKVLI